jgi:glycosyltransferase involved in cell wall biosynthesis
MTEAPRRFDYTHPCLVLAPPLEYPAHSGNIAMERKWAQFSNHVPFVDIIGKCTITRYRKGKLESQTVYNNYGIRKSSAAILTLMHRSHYLLEKFVTDDFRSEAQQYLSNPEYNLVIFSFIWTATVMDGLPTYADRLYCIETHNDELKWFDDLRKSFLNPAAKLTSYFSKKWLLSFLAKHEDDFLFFHVSQADYAGYLDYFPKHRGYVMPIGVDLPKNDIKCTLASDRIRLIFVGSLGVDMNLDALKIFRDEFFPVLKSTLGDKLELVIVGSHPSRTVRNICDEMGWALNANVSDKELQRLYQESTFSLLPFHYVTGRKLKILESLAHGVPFLATTTMADQIDEVIYPCLVSDDPDAWLKRILDVSNYGIDIGSKVKMSDYAMQYSWPEISKKMYQFLSSNFGQ